MNKLKSMLNSPKRIALFAVCVIVILALLAFAGIKVGASALNNQGIGLEKATQVALQNAGYSESEATLIRGHFDRDDGLNVYEIEFRAGGYDYDYVVSSKDGTIVSVDREMADGTLITDDNANGDTSASQTADKNSASQNSSNSSSNSSSDHIGVEKAKTIALQSAGVNASSATFTKAKLDMDDGIYVYDVEFVSGNYEYSYEIHASKGTILQRDAEAISTGEQQSNSSHISLEKAKSIALNAAGISSPERYTKTKLEKDDGRYVYEIEFVKQGREYSYEIDATNGNILDWDIENDD